MPESLNTRILIEKIQGGDQNALNDLLQRYYPRVLAAVRLRLGPVLRIKLQSMDIVQDVMIETCQRIDTFKFSSDGDLMRFLNKVVLNRIRDQADIWTTHKRNLKKEVLLENDRSSSAENPLNSIAGRSGLTPSKIVSHLEDFALLEKAMDRLAEKSEESRNLIVDVEIEGRTYAEIAAETGSNSDAVRMRLARAKAALRVIAKSLTKDK